MPKRKRRQGRRGGGKTFLRADSHLVTVFKRELARTREARERREWLGDVLLQERVFWALSKRHFMMQHYSKASPPSPPPPPHYNHFHHHHSKKWGTAADDECKPAAAAAATTTTVDGIIVSKHHPTASKFLAEKEALRVCKKICDTVVSNANLSSVASRILPKRLGGSSSLNDVLIAASSNLEKKARGMKRRADITECVVGSVILAAAAAVGEGGGGERGGRNPAVGAIISAVDDVISRLLNSTSVISMTSSLWQIYRNKASSSSSSSYPSPSSPFGTNPFAPLGGGGEDRSSTVVVNDGDDDDDDNDNDDDEDDDDDAETKTKTRNHHHRHHYKKQIQQQLDIGENAKHTNGKSSSIIPTFQGIVVRQALRDLWERTTTTTTSSSSSPPTAAAAATGTRNDSNLIAGDKDAIGGGGRGGRRGFLITYGKILLKAAISCWLFRGFDTIQRKGGGPLSSPGSLTFCRQKCLRRSVIRRVFNTFKMMMMMKKMTKKDGRERKIIPTTPLQPTTTTTTAAAAEFIRITSSSTQEEGAPTAAAVSGSAGATACAGASPVIAHETYFSPSSSPKSEIDDDGERALLEGIGKLGMVLSAQEEEEEEEEDVANISYEERRGGKREIMEIISLISGLCVIGGSQEEEDMANGIEYTEKVAAKVKNVLLSAFSCDDNNAKDDALSTSKRESKLCAIYPHRRYQYSQQHHQPPSPPMELLFLGSKDWPDTLYAAGALISLRKSRKKHGLTASSSSSSSSSSQAKRQRRREKRQQQQQQHALMDQESKEENEEESCSSRSKHLLSLGHRALRRIPVVSRRLLRRVCDDPAVQGLDALLRHYSVLFGAYTSKEENIKASIDLRMPSQIFQQLEMPNSSTNFLPSKPFSVGVPGKSADDHPSILVVLADSFHRKLLHLLAQLYSFPSESTSFGRTSEMRDERAHTGLKAVRVTLPEESRKALACLVDNGIDIQDYISSPG